jgi:hypothetical protein
MNSLNGMILLTPIVRKYETTLLFLRRAENYTPKSVQLPSSSVWHHKNSTHTDKLQQLQKGAARIFTNSSYEVNSEDISMEPFINTLQFDVKKL